MQRKMSRYDLALRLLSPRPRHDWLRAMKKRSESFFCQARTKNICVQNEASQDNGVGMIHVKRWKPDVEP